MLKLSLMFMALKHEMWVALYSLKRENSALTGQNMLAYQDKVIKSSEHLKQQCQWDGIPPSMFICYKWSLKMEGNALHNEYLFIASKKLS